MLTFIFIHSGLGLTRRVAQAVSRWRRRQLELRALRSLDESAMRDIGLSHRAAGEHWRAGPR